MSLSPYNPPDPGIDNLAPPPSLDAITPAPTPRRIPNLGHAALFLLFTAILLFLFELVILIVGGAQVTVHGGVTTVRHPKLQIAAEAATYVITLLIAWLVFPLLWHRRFLDGLRWHWHTAREYASRLIALGLLLGVMSAVVDYFVSSSKPPPIQQFFVTQSDAWLLTVFGIFVAPVFEEICFRGFLVPAFAIAYDWLSLPRTPEARARWQTTTALTPASLIFSAILSSILFALLHGTQVAYAWGALTVLFSVSIILTTVRVRTQSVAASTLVHSAYNSFIFLVTILQSGGYRHLDRLTK